jgi:predicted aspartyl protease
VKQWLLSLACLCLFFPSPLQAADQPEPSENASGGTLPFRLVSGYLIQVEGRIGDQTHLKFILDTGATISMVGERVAEKLKLDRHTTQSFNFDQNFNWKTATLPEVQFGPVRAANVVVLVGDLARYSEFAGKADAIIGMDLLNLRDVTIDFGAGNLIFESAAVKTYVPGGVGGRILEELECVQQGVVNAPCGGYRNQQNHAARIRIGDVLFSFVTMDGCSSSDSVQRAARTWLLALSSQYFCATGRTRRLAIKPTTMRPAMMCRITG